MTRIRLAWSRLGFALRGGVRLNGVKDEGTARSFHLMLACTLAWFLLLLAVAIPLFAVRKTGAALLCSVLAVATLGSLILLRTGRIRAASLFFLSVIWCGAELFSALNGAVKSGVYGLVVLVIVNVGWLLGRSSAIGLAIATLVIATIESLLDYFGHPLPLYFPGSPLGSLMVFAGILLFAVNPILAILDALKQQVADLRETDERFRSLSNLALEGIMIHRRGIILDANLSFARLFGYKPEEIIGRNGPELLLTAESQVLIRQRIERKETGLISVTGVRNDGSTFAAETDSRPVRYRGNDATLVSCHDVTDRIAAAERLRESEEKFRTLFESAGDATFITQDDVLIDCNARALEMFGCQTREHIVGRHPYELSPQMQPNGRGSRECAIEKVTAALAGRPQFFEWMHARLDGTPLPTEVSLNTLQLGTTKLLQGIIRDVSERKRAEEDRKKLQEQLTQAQKMESIGRLAGGVAHDFNNLLTVINGYSRLALGGLTEDHPLRDAVAEIQKAGERAVALTRQLLAFSRKQVLQPCVLDLNRVVQEMRPMLDSLVGEDVEVRVSLDARIGVVHADPHQVEQMIMNLAVNARDAMPGGGRLLIETAGVELDESYSRTHPEVCAGRYIVLAVGDSGHGMDEETRRRIFEPFFTTKPVGHGTGLGLSMVQGIAAQSGGHISVDSEPGRGTTFRIYLPALAGTAAGPATDAGGAGGVALGGSETVLVVEDLAEVREYAVTVLQAHGYRVIPAVDASEALLICAREGGGIHLVLTDIVMPNVSGLELAKELEKRWPHTKVLLMSGYADNVTQANGLLDEHVHFIEKPFSPEELARRVRAVLGRGRAAVDI
jgi:two-component system, cell cycle sensor histidine kinase and response regulator CckA